VSHSCETPRSRTGPGFLIGRQSALVLLQAAFQLSITRNTLYLLLTIIAANPTQLTTMRKCTPIWTACRIGEDEPKVASDPENSESDEVENVSEEDKEEDQDKSFDFNSIDSLRHNFKSTMPLTFSLFPNNQKTSDLHVHIQLVDKRSWHQLSIYQIHDTALNSDTEWL